MGKAIIAIIFAGLLAVLFFLIWWWMMGETPDSTDRKLGLRDRCNAVEAGMSFAELHEHFRERGWRSACMPDDDCLDIELDGEVYRLPCEGLACEARWQWSSWVCHVDVTAKTHRAMGPGTTEAK